MKDIIKIFDKLKCKSPNEPVLNFLVRDDEDKIVAYLKPIIKDYKLTDPYLPVLLSRWREENPTISTGNFKITIERTIKWLDELVINRSDRLIFVIYDFDNKPLGHIGFSNFNLGLETCELDSVLRGVKNQIPGLMKFCTMKLVKWAFEELELRDVELSVYSDNYSAIKFYEKIGFEITKRIPLVKIVLDNEEKFEIAGDDFIGEAEKYYLKMKFNKSNQ